MRRAKAAFTRTKDSDHLIQMQRYPGNAIVFFLMTSITASHTLQGCAHFCGNSGTREGAWGLVFRCSTSSRMESHYGKSAEIKEVTKVFEHRGYKFE